MLKNHFHCEFELTSWRLQTANLQLELDRNAAQVNIVVAQAGACQSVPRLSDLSVPLSQGDHDQPVPELAHHFIQPDLGQDRA